MAPSGRTQRATGAMPILRVNNLSKRFGGVSVINNVDLVVNEEETRCIIGPNGAGKSTLLRLLIGEYRPTSGTISYENHDITSMPMSNRVRRGMSIKFQAPSVYNALSVKENLRLPLQRASTNVDEELDATLARIKLTDHADDLAGELSHGERQWLEIGMCLSLRPKLVLLDEPAAGLSRDETAKTGELIHGLKKQGITFLVVDHDMTFIKQIADVVTVLHLGETLFEGTMEQAISNVDVIRVYLGTK
jgi:branched-chain amino acid transport system ATP-binding protein